MKACNLFWGLIKRKYRIPTKFIIPTTNFGRIFLVGLPTLLVTCMQNTDALSPEIPIQRFNTWATLFNLLVQHLVTQLFPR